MKQGKLKPEVAAKLKSEVLEALLQGKAYDLLMSGALPFEKIEKVSTSEELTALVEATSSLSEQPPRKSF